MHKFLPIEILVKRLTDDAKLPVFSTEYAAGMDLFSREEYIFRAMGDSWEKSAVPDRKLISTGISIEIPHGYHGEIRPRSSMALKGVTVLNSPGTIDSDYRGEIKVLLINLGTDMHHIMPGDKIAQMVITPHLSPNGIFAGREVTINESSHLSESGRGEGGFGSTGR